MFLKSLSLKGFKSFAEAATLEFEPGVTVVVGPNGSGKSNIVDAVAWVLGAQGARALRGAKMEDVIFAGTAKRTGLGRAEVSLTIDNSAGLLPIEFSEVRLTRVLWRSGESEYSINGAPCRLLDLQELLSDTGVGRQQHTIISQSQLDSILSARPEERRAVIEEAAGISKHRRRKERAERRLEATEADLLRAQDLLKEVRRQLRPLERQAEAARRHAGVVQELAALRRYLYGRELAGLQGRLRATGELRARLGAETEAALEALVAGQEAVATAERSLADARSAAEVADVAELVSAAEGLRARAAGTVALLKERARRAERERAANLDGDLVSSLEAEAASLAAQLEATDQEALGLLPREAELVEAEADLARESEAVQALLERLQAEAEASPRQEAGAVAGAVEGLVATRGPEPVAGPGAEEPTGTPPAQRATEVRAELSALGRSVEQAQAEAGRLEARSGQLEGRLHRLRSELEGAEAALAGAAGEAPGLDEAARSAAAVLAQAQEQAAQAEQARRDADAEQNRWSARAEALAQALDEARARAGARRLAGLPGLVGALVELVELDEGLGAAFEAAAGEALSAVLMDSEASARSALGHLASQGATGAVIALSGGQPSGDQPSGGQPTGGDGHAEWRPPAGPSLPAGARWLRPGARSAQPAVPALLDRLLERAVVVEGDWTAALDLALARPELVVVTQAGDRCAGGIWATGAHGTGATGAALEEARSALVAARAGAAQAASAQQQARSALELARSAHEASRRRLAENRALESSSAAARDRAVGDLGEVEAELASLSSQRADLGRRLQTEQARRTELTALLPELDQAAEQERRRAAAEREEQRRRLEAEREEQRRRAQAEREEQARRAAEERAARNRLAERASAVAVLRRDLEVRATGVEERRALLVSRLQEVERRLHGHLAQREQAALRRAELDAVAVAVARLETWTVGRTELLAGALDRLREQRRYQTEQLREATELLDTRRRELAAAERALAGANEQTAKAELEQAQLQGRLEALSETVQRDLECSPEELEGAECPELAEGVTPNSRARDLERELRLMGPVNPLALEEHAELAERHKFLEAQLADVTSARRELAKVIRAVDAEIISVFKSAYDDVAANFSGLVATLFPGGQGSLSLTDSANILESGVEVEVRPVGKNVRRLSLLSGGERSLVALAFLFAVFRSRPSPFYMMDEVESALDDVNLHRFLDLVNEFRAEAQLLIVSHQKRTMEAADCLYGVSMPPGGSSVVVSQKVEDAPAGQRG